jgi:holliday junction DNA helicase RuvB
MNGNPERKLISAERRDEDAAEASLRPQRLSEFIGQRQACANLAVFIQAARARREALDHVLFVGPPGLISAPLRDRSLPKPATSPRF